MWCGFVAVTSFWMWASVQTWLEGSLFEVQISANLIVLAILFIILMSLLSVGFIIFQNRLWSIGFSLVIGILYLVLFGVSNLNLAGVFMAVMLFYHAQDIMVGEVKERIKMNSRLLIKKGLANFIVAFFILMSFAAYQSPAIEEFKNIKQLPSSSEIFVKTIVEQAVEAQLNEASQEQKELVLNQAAREIVSRINSFLRPYFQYVPPALAFGLFLVLWSVGWIFVLLSAFLGMFIFWIFRKIKFFTIVERDVKAEVIVI